MESGLVRGLAQEWEPDRTPNVPIKHLHSCVRWPLFLCVHTQVLKKEILVDGQDLPDVGPWCPADSMLGVSALRACLLALYEGVTLGKSLASLGLSCHLIFN